jgi:hypothetical protein
MLSYFKEPENYISRITVVEANMDLIADKIGINLS